MSSSLSGLRKKHEIEIENLTLTSQPFRTLKLFILATILYVKRSISFLLTKGSWFLLLSILTVGFGVLLITIDGPHEKAKWNNKIQISILNMKNSIAGIFLSINDWKPVFLTRIPHVEEFLQYFRFGLWWVALGVASSIGLGSGLHTFVLYLGPHIALFTIKAMKCGRVDLKSAPYDTIQVDRSASWLDKNCSEFGPPMFPAVGGLSVPLSSILPQVQLEAILWGFGTALGELPPYFISRAASMSGATLDAMEELNVSSTENEGFISRHLNQLKRWFFSHAQHLNFFSILVLASVPNPLFDLAGIMCGQFGIPFWNFFLATLIGKAIVKTHIQTAFIISVCNNQLLDWIENELIWVLGFVPGLSSILPNLISKLHAVKEKYLAPPAPLSSSDKVQKWWNLSITSVWNTVVWLMLFNFFIKIVNSTAQRYLKKQQECEMVALTNKLAANSNGGT